MKSPKRVTYKLRIQQIPTQLQSTIGLFMLLLLLLLLLLPKLLLVYVKSAILLLKRVMCCVLVAPPRVTLRAWHCVPLHLRCLDSSAIVYPYRTPTWREAPEADAENNGRPERLVSGICSFECPIFTVYSPSGTRGPCTPMGGFGSSPCRHRRSFLTTT